MTKQMSIFLDGLRFSAAIAVLIGHLSGPGWSHVGPDLIRCATFAVAVFFVLSGYVISFVVQTKEKTVRAYAISRLSRLYSVLIPATIFSVIVYFLALARDPAIVMAVLSHSSRLSAHPYGALTLVYTSLLPWTFLSSFHTSFLLLLPGLDSPMWSLAFEFAYYVVFAVWAYGRGYGRIVGVTVGCILMGRLALALFPIWILGVLLQRLTVRIGLMKNNRGRLGAFSLLGFALTLAAAGPYIAWCNSPHNPRVTYLLHGDNSMAIPYLYFLAALMTLWLILTVAFLQTWLGPFFDALERPVRWLAGNTFSIYLFHLPVLVLLHAVTRYNPASRVEVAAVFFADILICLLLATVSEHRKVWWRTLIAGVFAHVARMLRAITLAPHPIPDKR
jgi:peptidoglycan/LPS O-acetylase OafA/YrhL